MDLPIAQKLLRRKPLKMFFTVRKKRVILRTVHFCETKMVLIAENPSWNLFLRVYEGPGSVLGLLLL